MIQKETKIDKLLIKYDTIIEIHLKRLKMIEKKEMKDKDKLADFLKNTDYTISKLFEVMHTTDESKKSFYISLLNPLINKYKQMEEELSKRGILPNDFWDDELEKIKYIFDSLNDNFSENKRSFVSNDIFIFLEFFRDKNKELFEQLRIIDDEKKI